MNKQKPNEIQDPDLADFDDISKEKSEEKKITYPAHEELVKQISALEEKVARYQAELDNLHKRNRIEIEKTHKYAIERFAKELLVVVDSLERALGQETDAHIAALRTGLELTLKLFQDTLAKFSVKVINPVGETFDPVLHEAMSMQESADQKSGTVLQVLQKGYQLHDRLLRPALVVVAKAPG